MDEILQHSEAMKNHCLLVVAGESSFHGFLGGAGFRPPTVGAACSTRFPLASSTVRLVHNRVVHQRGSATHGTCHKE